MRAKRFLGKDASLDPFLLSLNTVDSLFYIYRTWIVINLLDPGVSSLAALFSHSPLLLLPVFLLSHFSPPLFSFFLFSPPFTTRRRIEQLWSSHSACLRPCNCEINHCHPLFSLSLFLSLSHVHSIPFFGTRTLHPRSIGVCRGRWSSSKLQLSADFSVSDGWTSSRLERNAEERIN